MNKGGGGRGESYTPVANIYHPYRVFFLSKQKLEDKSQHIDPENLPSLLLCWPKHTCSAQQVLLNHSLIALQPPRDSCVCWGGGSISHEKALHLVKPVLQLWWDQWVSLPARFSDYTGMLFYSQPFTKLCYCISVKYRQVTHLYVIFESE